jgi:hypothetical protein
MKFFLLTLGLLLVGRKVGWALSKRLYGGPKGLVVMFCLIWGPGIAMAIRLLIDANQPGLLLRWIMGYALGAYVSIPNFGLFDESTIPDERLPQHVLLKGVPWLLYMILSVLMAFRHVLTGA